ncbi:hypothetical protein [Alysiella filiformis]|nr:hypothetical protein [Alysiella filiformis]
MPQLKYRAKCLDCKHQWTSQLRSDPPRSCPQCNSNKISSSPL